MPAKRTGINRERLEKRFSVLSLSLGEAQEEERACYEIHYRHFAGLDC
jgi:hypothetical protein